MLQPMYDGFPLGLAVIAVGFVGLMLGFAVLHRVTRDPEDGADHWRSHRH
jgi:hypothetical protein